MLLTGGFRVIMKDKAYAKESRDSRDLSCSPFMKQKGQLKKFERIL